MDPLINGNKVYLHQRGFIEIETVGQQTADSVVAMGEAAKVLAKDLRAEGKRVLILDNLTRLGLRQPSEVPKAVGAVAKQLDFDRAVMLGPGNVLLKYGATFIIRGAGLGNKIKYFGDRTAAEKWLLSTD